MRFTCTSHKDYIRQLTQIEWCQARIQQICKASKATTVPTEVVPNILDEHYNIGKSQHLPIDLNSFIQKNMDDPAITVGVTDWILFWKLITQFPGLHSEVEVSSPSPHFGNTWLCPRVKQHFPANDLSSTVQRWPYISTQGASCKLYHL